MPEPIRLGYPEQTYDVELHRHVEARLRALLRKPVKYREISPAGERGLRIEQSWLATFSGLAHAERYGYRSLPAGLNVNLDRARALAASTPQRDEPELIFDARRQAQQLIEEVNQWQT